MVLYIRKEKSTVEIPEMSYKGIKRIEIPYTDGDFSPENGYGLSIFKKYMGRIFSTHEKNAEKVAYFWEYMRGEQDIELKTRPYDKDAYNNNKITENHAFRQTQFKVGFLTGDTREYTHKSDVKSDDLTYLGRYFTDVDFFSKDKDLKEWIYATGIGVDYIAPRTDIILQTNRVAIDGSPILRYATKADGYNIETEAPFEYDVLSPVDNFVVYSSGRKKEPLFCVSIVDQDVGKNDEIDLQKHITIETRYAYFECECDNRYRNVSDVVKLDLPDKTLRYLPMTEHSVNSSRIGLVELNRPLFNLVNMLLSNIADMVVQNSNVIFVFKGVQMDADEIRDMIAAGAIILPIVQGNASVQPDLTTLKVEIPFDGLDQYYEQRISKMYDIAGVPLASGQVTSGGDTGDARRLGGGWENAYTLINNDIRTLLRGDYEILKKILMICRTVPNCPVNELYASQIDIKYNINKNDNLLVKAQSIRELYNSNMPKKHILKAAQLFNDIDTVADDWDRKDEEIKAEENAAETTTADANGVIISQE